MTFTKANRVGETIPQSTPRRSKWIEVYAPYLVLREKIKRFSMVRFSTIKNCYLLPATT
jgi:hypothetical protein